MRIVSLSPTPSPDIVIKPLDDRIFTVTMDGRLMAVVIYVQDAWRQDGLFETIFSAPPTADLSDRGE